MPADEGIDPRWQAIIAIGQYTESEPEAVWCFIRQWGGNAQEDLRNAVATCLLEHLLEYHFAEYFPRVEQLARSDHLFADTVGRCWQFGKAEDPDNWRRLQALLESVRKGRDN
jgi:hypothetical protein